MTKIPTKIYNKYGNTKVNGFDSKGEYYRYLELHLLQKSGKISDLQCQVPFVLVDKQPGERSAKIVMDFTYTENKKRVVEDFKGFRTEVYKLKRKMFKARYPEIEFREVR